jgi:hypothetical protein
LSGSRDGAIRRDEGVRRKSCGELNADMMPTD